MKVGYVYLLPKLQHYTIDLHCTHRQCYTVGPPLSEYLCAAESQKCLVETTLIQHTPVTKYY